MDPSSATDTASHSSARGSRGDIGSAAAAGKQLQFGTGGGAVPVGMVPNGSRPGSRIGSRAELHSGSGGEGRRGSSAGDSSAQLERMGLGARRIMAEDSQWNLATVESLTSMCVRAIVERFEDHPVLAGLPAKYRSRVLASISVDIPLAKVVSIIDDDAPSALRPGYWQRRSAAHFPDAELARHGGKWKRLYCERTLEKELAAFVPGRGADFALGELAKALAPNVVRLQVDQLQPDANHADPAERKATDPNPDHVDPDVLVSHLDQLRDVTLYYGVKDVGVQFEWWLFGMTSNDSTYLSRALRRARWTSLTLSRCCIDDAKLATLCEGLKDHKYLVSLKLDHNRIGDQGAQSLARVLQSRHCALRVLDLGNNRIGALGSAHLAQALQHLSRSRRALASLVLRLNPLGNDGAFVVAYALHSAVDDPASLGFGRLDLAATAMGPSSLEQCAALVAGDIVEELDLSCNAFVANDPDIAAAAAAAAAATAAASTTAGVMASAALGSAAGGATLSAVAAAERDKMVEALGKTVWNSVQSSKRIKALDLRMTDLPESVVQAVQAALQQRAAAV
ncbi:hypothetical protein H9P43_002902 [Blastocladiella emersonii ATCC 22665]|nr:hypothetical protein H9P43_002902 [Blastocladiella emersonii ATCC 22665]